MADAAATVPGTDPGRASFAIAWQAARDQIIQAAGVIAGTTINLVGAIGRHVLDNLLPARRLRVSPGYCLWDGGARLVVCDGGADTTAQPRCPTDGEESARGLLSLPGLDPILSARREQASDVQKRECPPAARRATPAPRHAETTAASQQPGSAP